MDGFRHLKFLETDTKLNMSENYIIHELNEEFSPTFLKNIPNTKDIFGKVGYTGVEIGMD